MTPTPLIIDHAITSTDVHSLMLRFNLSMDELSELLSIPKSKLPTFLSTPGPVKDVAVALLVRAYSEFPHLLSRFDIHEFYNSLTEADEQKKLRHLSVYFGRDSSASYRWINKGRPMSDQPLSLGRLMKRLPDGADDLRRLSIKEAKLRGVNPYKTGSWTKPEVFDSSALTGRTYKKRATPGLKTKQPGATSRPTQKNSPSRKETQS